MEGIGQILGNARRSYEELVQVVHGTTVATNLILEHKGAVAGLLTTTGFRHLLEIGRHDIPRGANLFSWQKPKRPIPPDRIFEIDGLLDDVGNEKEPLDLAAVKIAARRLRAKGVAAVAICFLHSYANRDHEQRAREALLEEWPDVHVTISSEVLPTFREFERSMATILNAYVMPAVSSYVKTLEGRLQEENVAAPLLLMKSNGGVAGSGTIRREPVQTALSGPAAGVVGMCCFARLAGISDVIGVDIGGTSVDISLVKAGVPRMTLQGRVGDWPLTLPMVDINTIGAGGGAIARVSESGVLSVGPDSAGAQPGPVCYSRGGTEPTVTDAHATLGHLPSTLLNGAMTLDLRAARAAIDQKVARHLGMSVEDAARGILAVADNAIVGAIRLVSIERGHDPREFALVPFGGAGPLHGGALARLLGVKKLLLPPSPGVLSAIGLLVSSLRSDFQQTHFHRPDDTDLGGVASGFESLERAATRWFAEEGAPEDGRSVRRLLSMRYQGQGFELQVPYLCGALTADGMSKAVQQFHQLHESLYTFRQDEVPVEVVTLHVEATAALPPPTFKELPPSGAVAGALLRSQDVHFADGTRTTPIYDRAKLGAGAQVRGPALFTQLDTTILMLPGQIATIDGYGNMIVQECS